MFWGRLPFVTLSFGYSTICNIILARHHCNNITVMTTNADTSAKCNTIVHDNICGTNVIIMISLILVTVWNVFADTLFINLFCSHAVFERSTYWEWHNPSWTYSDSGGDPLEQSCLGVGNTKTRRPLCQQFTIIYCSMFRLHTVTREREREREREKEKICKGLWTDKKDTSPAWPNSLNANFWQLTDRLLFQN